MKIADLTVSKELDSKEMAGVRGGNSPFINIDFSQGFTSKVADVDQVFEMAYGQGNAGTVTNNQEFLGGNGLSLAPVDQAQYQDNWMTVYGIGNTTVF